MIESLSTTYANCVFAKDVNELTQINNKEINIAIQNRDIDELSDNINKLLAVNFKCELKGEKSHILNSLNKVFQHNELSIIALYNDISNILSNFMEISNSSEFRLTLKTVNDNMCSKFHTDINDLRLLCSYQGAGTLWLPDNIVNSVKDQNLSQTDWEAEFPEMIQQVQTGALTILKGALFPGAQPIMHKSPNIEELNQKRLLLRIDTNQILNF